MSELREAYLRSIGSPPEPEEEDASSDQEEKNLLIYVQHLKGL